MPTPQKPHPAMPTTPMQADPAHAPGKQHIRLDADRRAHGDPRQQQRSMPVQRTSGRKAGMQRGR